MRTDITSNFSWYLFIFALFLATTKIFGTPFLVLFVLVGSVIGLGKSLILAKTVLRVFFVFFIITTVSFLFRRGSFDFLEYGIQLYLLLGSLAIAQRVPRIKTDNYYRFCLALLSLLIVVYSLLRLYGMSSLDTTQLILPNSSYHMIWWLCLLLVTPCLMTLSYRDGPNYSSHKIIVICSLFLFLSFLLGGRTGVVMGFFLFVASIYTWNKRITIVCGSFLFFLILTYPEFIEKLIQAISTDLYERGTKASVRSVIWSCYFDNLSLRDILVGFDKSEVAGNCLSAVGWYDEGDLSVKTESSFISLLSATGIVGVLYVIYLIFRSLINEHRYTMHSALMLTLLVRVVSGDYLFFSIYDWFFFSLTLGYQDD